MAEHTPGPWFRTQAATGYQPVVFEDSKEAMEICMMTTDFNTETTEANARLIAASPDLLAACEVAMRIADLWYPANAGGPIDDPENHEAYALHLIREKFTAAIAKAKGPQ